MEGTLRVCGAAVNRLIWVRIPALQPCGCSSMVECNLAKVEVGGSNPLIRSIGLFTFLVDLDKTSNSSLTIFGLAVRMSRGLD